MVTPGERELCLTLVVTEWDKRLGTVRRQLRTVWTPWEGWPRSGREMLTEAVQLASDTVARQDPLF